MFTALNLCPIVNGVRPSLNVRAECFFAFTCSFEWVGRALIQRASDSLRDAPRGACGAGEACRAIWYHAIPRIAGVGSGPHSYSTHFPPRQMCSLIVTAPNSVFFMRAARRFIGASNRFRRFYRTPCPHLLAHDCQVLQRRLANTALPQMAPT